MKRHCAWLILVFVGANFGLACKDDPEKEEAEDIKDSGSSQDTPPDTGDQISGDPCSQENPWGCNPVTNEGCAGAGSACVWVVENGVAGFTCKFDSVLGEGRACTTRDIESAEYCGPGMICMFDYCVPYCCSDADCVEGSCVGQELSPLTGDFLGVCSAEQKQGDPCTTENPWDCNPATNEGCAAGETCSWMNKWGVDGFTCEPDGTEAEGAACTQRDAEGPYCGPGFRCFKGNCVPYCCSGDDCPLNNCNYHQNWENEISGENYTGENLGICVDKQEQGDPCSAENPWDCNPETNSGCGEGQACLWTYGQDRVHRFECRDSATEPVGQPCDNASGLFCRGGSTCVEGTCVAFCCSDSHCDSQDTNCNFHQRWGDDVEGGSLGLCLNQQTQGNPCEIGDSYGWECNPTAEPSSCGAGETCQWTDEAGIKAFTCELGATQNEGDSCSNLPGGPQCKNGLTCHNSKCVKYCCSDADCEAPIICDYHNYYSWGNHVVGNELGLCAPLRRECPSSPWACINADSCLGTGHLAEYQCSASARHVCCEPRSGAVDAGLGPCDGIGFKCMGLVSAREGECPGWIRYDLECSNDQACCELEPFFDHGSGANPNDAGL